jgi:light-regulated signal transduction histidine kinase (bacteriophytochrome)
VKWSIGFLPDVAGDPTLLTLVVTNLISNAVKFSRDRELPEIKIDSTINEDEVIVTVKDNGAGFDMRYADKLFGVFQRLHRSDEFDGTGIGLANVRRIIQRHGGRTWAEGAVGEGATFYFTLPLSPERLAV